MPDDPSQGLHDLTDEEGVQPADAADSAVPDDETIDVAGPEADDVAPSAVADQLTQMQRERDEYLDGLRRERAEFENYRRRATKERMDALDRGAEQVMSGLLAVLDNFGFALAAADGHADDQLAKGVQMVHSQLLDTLRAAGLEDVPGVGETFDPNHHEAVAKVDAQEPADHPVVVEVLRPGYRFKGRVLRPATVKVAG